MSDRVDMVKAFVVLDTECPLSDSAENLIELVNSYQKTLDHVREGVKGAMGEALRLRERLNSISDGGHKVDAVPD